MDNTNLLFSINRHLMYESERGAVRETFFVNQLKDIVKISLSDKGDFNVGDKYVFEIGGKSKGFNQINGVKNSYVAADNIEIGQGRKIPLYQFGFLY